MKLTAAAKLEIERRWQGTIGDYFDTSEDPDVCSRALDARYVYPRLSELVGPTLPQHREPDGSLTLERKAQLLLIGVFEWSGLFIAKTDAPADGRSRGWVAAHVYDRDRPLQLLTDEHRSRGKPVNEYRTWGACLAGRRGYYFAPLAEFDPKPLETILSGCPADKRVGFVDYNPFNCHADNMVLLSKRGRPKHCDQCEREVFDGAHFTLPLSGRRVLRLCNECRAKLGPECDETNLKRIWRRYP